MRTLRVNRDLTVDEIDVDPDDWMAEDVDWDAARIAGGTHDAYVDENGIFAPGCVMASIDGHTLPLPAWIVRVDGEDVADATLGVDELRAMIA